MSKLSVVLTTGILFCNLVVVAKPQIVHATVNKPLYLESSLYESIKKQVPAVPEMNSAEQKADEAEIRRYQKERSKADCDNAGTEAKVSLNNFFGKPKGSLTADQVKKLSPFFEQLRNDSDYFIQNIKKEVTRKRPFMYMDGIESCVHQEVTGAYPSGHATLSKLYALVLGDFFPEQASAFEARSVEIGKNRVLSGMHHPTDIEAGRTLGKAIYTELKKSKSYNLAFDDLLSQLGSKQTQAGKKNLEATK